MKVPQPLPQTITASLEPNILWLSLSRGEAAWRREVNLKTFYSFFVLRNKGQTGKRFWHRDA